MPHSIMKCAGVNHAKINEFTHSETQHLWLSFGRVVFQQWVDFYQAKLYFIVFIDFKYNSDNWNLPKAGGDASENLKS